MEILENNFAQLYKKLSKISSELVSEVLPKYISGQVKPKEQNHAEASFTKIYKREDGKIDWTKPAIETYNQIRALNPEPGTWTTLEGRIVKILASEMLPEMKVELPGKLYRTTKGLAVKASDQSLLINLIQSEGKKPMSGSDFLNGVKNMERKHFV